MTQSSVRPYRIVFQAVLAGLVAGVSFLLQWLGLKTSGGQVMMCPCMMTPQMVEYMQKMMPLMETSKGKG